MSVQAVRDLNSKQPLVLHFLSGGDAVVIVETQRLDDIDRNNAMRISLHVSMFVVRVFHDHSMTKEPFYALCLEST